MQPLKGWEKKRNKIFLIYRHRFEASENVEHLVFGEAARDELKVMADVWMQATAGWRGLGGGRKAAFGDPRGAPTGKSREPKLLISTQAITV